MNSLFKQIIFLALTFALLIILFQNIAVPFEGTKTQAVPFNKLVQLVEEGKIKSIELKTDGAISGTLEDDSLVTTRAIGNESLVSTFKEYGVPLEAIRKITIEARGNGGLMNFLSILIPTALPILFIGGFLFLLYRQAQGFSSKTFSLGQSAGKQMNYDGAGKGDVSVKTKFKDVAGVKEAKEELMEVIDFLKNSKKFTDLGARIPRGVLLIGPPGCGKTLLAKAVAGEADVPFFHISGSEFMELFVGVGASRVRGLFQKAKRHAPCIIFIDELDSIGRKRGIGFGGAHDERDQTLNQILVEMDGFETDTNVIVMAATNRPDVLDSALLRPGRFDRRVVIDLPDIASREEMLNVHAKGKPLSPEVNLRRVAERTPGFSGADLAHLMNEAAILSARRNKSLIAMEELLPSIEKVILGPERKSRVITDKEKKITAYHEAGHAIVAHIMPDADPVHKISVIARGEAGGYTLKIPEKDKYLHSRQEFMADLAVSMGGMAAEKIIFNEMTTGASGDLRHASSLARKLVTRYGMSDAIGPVSFELEETNGFSSLPWEESKNSYSDHTLEGIDTEVARILEEAYNKAKEIIEQHISKLEIIAKKLLEQETIEKEEFEKLMQADASQR
ncbi:MAG: ATP-dependent zinc metalloprotease FtsH [Candidatus Jacksonbacteria bacterium]|nr:ATP-dependent zinc metalloprotease FtsH [Candidatus Jacksonbacteria bacterium]